MFESKRIICKLDNSLFSQNQTINYYMNHIAFIALLFLFTSCFTSEITQTETEQYRFSKIVNSEIDSTTYNTILPYKEKLDQTMNSVLAKTDKPMVKDLPEGLLGNLISDIILYEGNKHFTSADGHGIDFCMLNNGGLRATLPYGDITRGKLFELMPFENEMIVLELDGKTTLELINYIAKVGGVPVAGLRFEIESNKAQKIMINGQEFDPTKTYKMVTSDYLAGGGDKLAMLNNRLNSELLGVKIRDAIINYFIEKNSNGELITSSLDGRIKYAH